MTVPPAMPPAQNPGSDLTRVRPRRCACSTAACPVCGGEGHGHLTRDARAVGAAAFQSRPDVRPTGFTNAMLAAISDEEF